MTNKEKAEYTYRMLQKRKEKKARQKDYELTSYDVATKGRFWRKRKVGQ